MHKIRKNKYCICIYRSGFDFNIDFYSAADCIYNFYIIYKL